MVVQHYIKETRYGLHADYSKLLGPDWSIFLKDMLESDYASYLAHMLDQIYLSGDKVYPTKKEDLFKAFTATNFDEIKVVIIGSEPKNELSNGLAFGTYGAVKDPIKCPHLNLIQDNLKFNKLVSEHRFFDRSMVSWTQQGVMMLNSSLVADSTLPNKYSLYFRNFTREVIKALSEEKAGIVFAFTSTELYNLYKDSIDDAYHYIFHYPVVDMSCDIFDDINEKLKDTREIPIIW